MPPAQVSADQVVHPPQGLMAHTLVCPLPSPLWALLSEMQPWTTGGHPFFPWLLRALPGAPLCHPRGPSHIPHLSCLAFAWIVCGGRALITAQELSPGVGTSARGVGCPRRGQCEQGLRGQVGGWGSVNWGWGCTAGVKALLRTGTLWSLCELSSHCQATLKGSDPGLPL